MQNEYIDKGALYDALWDAKEEKQVKSLKGVFDFIDKFPVEDVVPVVRCRECKHFKTNINKENYCDIHSTRWDKFYVNENEYCSRGEKR